MKKAISILIATFVMALAIPLLAAETTPELHMNFRFVDNTYSGTQPSQVTAENHMTLHVVEVSAAQEYDNIGGYILYRLGDQGVTSAASAPRSSYPVEAKVYYKTGGFKISEGLQFVPFGIYKWNNLYNPFLDIPGQAGMIWDSDWGTLVNYNAKPVNIDLGFWTNAGTTYNTNTQLLAKTTPQIRKESAEKDTFTGRIGVDILKNLNAGASYLDGKVDNNYDGIALATKKVWALDTTWGAVANLQLEAEYAGYKYGAEAANPLAVAPAGAAVAADKGDLGLIQLKYDITKVPGPLNKITPVIEYSWLHDKTSGLKVKNYQEELWIKAGKNLDFFPQFMQEKYNTPGAKTDKRGVLAFKYSFQ
jgi:hypothetical protein